MAAQRRFAPVTIPERRVHDGLIGALRMTEMRSPSPEWFIDDLMAYLGPPTTSASSPRWRWRVAVNDQVEADEGMA